MERCSVRKNSQAKVSYSTKKSVKCERGGNSMAYYSLFLSLFYLMSCPLIAIVDVKDFDNLYVFFPVLQAVAYIFYLLKDFKDYSNSSQEEDTEQVQDKKLMYCFHIFNVLYIAFLMVLSFLTMNTIVLSFVLYPLGLKVAVADALFINEANGNSSTKIGE